MVNINNITTGNEATAVADVTVGPATADGASGTIESCYQNTEFAQQYGYFLSIPELHSAFIMKSVWTLGKGYECDPETRVITDHIRGMGKSCFRDILFNLDLVKNIGGDSFAEIIHDEETGVLLNLKPIDPGSIRIIYDKNGILRYEQTSKIDKSIIKFRPEEIFHLSNCVFADQPHGISRIKPMEKIILALNESFVDSKQIMHRQARPLIIFKLKTDDPAKISQVISKIDQAMAKGNNVYVPDDENILEYEVVNVPVSQLITEWRNSLNNIFYRAVGMPLVLFGQAGTTESGGKIEYLGHEQVFEHDQKYLEEQIWSQLSLRIKLNSPVTLLDNLQNDQAKDANQGMEIQPNDLTAGRGR